ncbi:MAG TPA: hypothetical protein VFB12_20600 [Ktedonobacteraceae bacterium]|nr:hypothetical protein [Ktedonobacteraceae bacterium]
MTTNTIPPDNEDRARNVSSEPAQAPHQRAPYLARYALLLLITVAFFSFNQPFNLATIFLFIMMLLGTPIFDFLYTHVDRLDPFFDRSAKDLTAFFQKLLPVIGLIFHYQIDTRAYLASLSYTRKHLGRVTAIFVTFVFLGEMAYPLAHNQIFALGASFNDSICVGTSINLQSYCGNGLGVDPFSTDDGTVYIGLIDHHSAFPFDHSGLNGPEQQVEKLIFQEDKASCVSPQHITLAAVTMLSRTVDDVTLSAQVGVEDLQGAYLAQMENDKDSPVKLCLVIGNIGTRLTTEQTIPLVLKRVVRYSKYDPTFRGIMGFPFSSTAEIATSTLKNWSQTGFPLISPSATTDHLNNVPNFYRVASSNQLQGKVMEQFLAQAFQTRFRPRPMTVAVFADPDDPYSKTLSTDFIQSVDSDTPSPNITTFSETYQVESAASLSAPLADALQQTTQHPPADLIFFSGYAYDLDALENDLQNAQAQSPLLHTHLPIVGGDGIYDLSHYIANPYSPVYSTIYASPIPINDPFVNSYRHAFGSNPISTSADVTYALFPPHVILAHDATAAFLSAIHTLLQRGEDLSQTNMNAAVATVTFSGKSGPISFQGNCGNANNCNSSNPLNKTVYVLCTDHNHALHNAASDNPGTPLNIVASELAKCS